MSKIRRGGHSAEGETLSAGRVEYLEAARARVRTRRIRRTVIIVAVLTILVLFATGAVGSSIARAKDLVDTAVIAPQPQAGRSRPASPTRMRWRRCLAALGRWAATAAWYTVLAAPA